MEMLPHGWRPGQICYDHDDYKKCEKMKRYAPKCNYYQCGNEERDSDVFPYVLHRRSLSPIILSAGV